MRPGFHWRDINNSKPLQFLLGILMDASGPMTGMEIQMEAQRRGGWVANPATGLGEIAQNAGYVVSDGARYGQKPGPAVRFPDGKYRYWLISAPGWTCPWRVDEEFRVRSESSAECGVRSVECESTSERQQDRRCENPVCGRVIAADGPPWCEGSEVCKREYFKGLQGSLFTG